MTVYETFTVMKGEVMTPPDVRRVNENTLFQSIKQAVTKEMELRGYKFVPDSSAQLYISYVGGAYNLTEGGNTGPLGQTPASTPADMDQSRSWSRESSEGMIVIDITDSSSKKELWNVHGTDPDLCSLRAYEAIEGTLVQVCPPLQFRLSRYAPDQT